MRNWRGTVQTSLRLANQSNHCCSLTPALLATGGTDDTVILWNVATGQELLTLRRPGLIVGSLKFAPSGDTLAAGVLRHFGARGPVELWRAPSFEEIAAAEKSKEEKK